MTRVQTRNHASQITSEFDGNYGDDVIDRQFRNSEETSRIFGSSQQRPIPWRKLEKNPDYRKKKRILNAYFGDAERVGRVLEDGRVVVDIRHADVHRNAETLYIKIQFMLLSLGSKQESNSQQLTLWMKSHIKSS